MSLLGLLLDPSGLTPHGFCLSWVSGLIWLHAGSDALIALSYLSIPISLIWLIRGCRDRTYSWIACLFVTFIVACAIAHGLAVLTLWVPAYLIEGLAKAVTAAASITTAATLWIMTPRVADILSPVELTSLNAELAYTIAKQETTLHEMLGMEQKLRHSNSVLDQKVAEHAAELRVSNAQLLELFAERVATREALTKSEAEYRASFEAAIIGKVQMEPISGRLLRVNEAFASILGYEAKDLVGREIWELAYPADRDAAQNEFKKLLTGEIDIWVVEKRFVRRDGMPVGVRISATVIIDPALGLPRLAVAEIEDADLRRASQAALQVSEVRLHLALESAQFGTWELDIRNDLFRGDNRYAAMTSGAVPAETWLAMSAPYQTEWVKHIHPEDRDHREAQLRILVVGETRMVPIEYRVRRADCGWTVLLHRCAVVERDPVTGVPVRAIGVVADVTERAMALIEARGEKASLEHEMEKRSAVLAHRQLLLREVYHRMNDTMQTVDLLLAAQARQQGDREALAALTTQRSRISALGLAHGALMTSVTVETFEIGPFLHDLCDAVLANATDPGISLHVDESDLKVTPDDAIPLGLLVTEILISCLGHASSSEDRRIAVTLQRCADGEMTLIVTDAGIANPAQTAFFRAGLETRLVRDLLGQLGAEMKVRCDEGLRVETTILPRPS